MKRTELPRAEALCARYLDKNRPVLAAVWRLGTDVTFLPEGGDAACFVRIIPR